VFSTKVPLVALKLSDRSVLASEMSRLWAEGVAVLPLDPSLPGEATRRLLGRLRPDRLIDDSGENVLPSGEGAAEGTAAVLLTSGTTGEPKAVELSRSALEAAARLTNARLRAALGDVWLCPLPLHHIAGLAILWRAEELGAPVHLLPEGSFEPARLTRSGANFTSLVPTMLKRALDEDADLSDFKAILVGGAAIPQDLVDRGRAAGLKLVRTYGMTETCGGVVYDGLPLDGVEVAIDPGGRIRLRTPTVMNGYRGAPEASAEVLQEGWFLTSDEGVVEDGRLKVLGRLDSVIVTGGEKVDPREVAECLLHHPDVREARVFGAPDADWGQRVEAAVRISAGSSIRDEDLAAFVREHLPGYMVPKRIEVRTDERLG
jgi:O-succinylbenzoic acid--CoA ligase